MKRIETIIIEKLLLSSLYGTNPKLAKEYGTTEVTLSSRGAAKELVDFLSYDPVKNTYRCCEIKVSMQDFKSDAKKSWYGNYNYLVVTDTLWREQSPDAWKSQLPEGVGVITVNVDKFTKTTPIKAKKQNIDENRKEFLKTSLLRTMFYQNQNPDWYLRRN